MRAFIIALCSAASTLSAAAQEFRAEAQAAAELREMCAADNGRLWNVSLCGPLIVVDPGTRQAWATQRDDLNVLTRAAEGGWTGALPEGVPIANTTVEWADVRWIMVIGPLPEDQTARRVLLAHEAWHRVQASIGLPMQNANAAHLETERGRYLLRLELRALATAMLSNGHARRNAAKDALAFRMARLSSFPDALSAEASLDRNEGLAAYTGVVLGAGGQASLHAARTLDAYDDHEAFARAYAYASGPAYGLLLDEYAPSWRGNLASWAPADLLVGPLRVRPLSARNLQRSARRYGGPEIAGEERLRSERRQRLIASLRTQFSGARLELPLGQMQFEFDPGAVTPVEGLGTVYQRLVLRDLWGELRAHQGALISPNFNMLTAAHPEPGGLSGPGWTLSLTPAYRISAPDASGVVRPEPAVAPSATVSPPRN